MSPSSPSPKDSPELVPSCPSTPPNSSPPSASTDRFEFERRLHTAGIPFLAGVDEVGRGPLAGPVVAAAVILPVQWIQDGLPPELEGLNDSKQIPGRRREQFAAFLTQNPAVRFTVSTIDSEEIDRINILRATHLAMVRCLDALRPPPGHVLVDGLPVAAITLPQTALVKGDSRSYSIAAASVIAKVHRDQLMTDYDREWPQYGFAIHKGYPTAQHLQALARYGPCRIHRRSFAPVRAAQLDLFQT
ncbi:MAG: ribonuclease HII [Verrucomicrobiales bacterium]|nr:ribonuclease HII [Verrucomicrobiales bacterium]